MLLLLPDKLHAIFTLHGHEGSQVQHCRRLLAGPGVTLAIKSGVMPLCPADESGIYEGLTLNVMSLHQLQPLSKDDGGGNVNCVTCLPLLVFRWLVQFLLTCVPCPSDSR